MAPSQPAQLPIETRLLLWSAPRHSGKTTAVTRLVQRARDQALRVAGILSPSIYQEGALTGFDLQDITTGRRTALAQRARSVPGTDQAGPFAFTAEGLRAGRQALTATAVADADLIIIDDYGPLELDGGGWRPSVDNLLDNTGAPILLVVRKDLESNIRGLYPRFPNAAVPALESASINRVLDLIRRRKRLPGVAPAC